MRVPKAIVELIEEIIDEVLVVEPHSDVLKDLIAHQNALEGLRCLAIWCEGDSIPADKLLKIYREKYKESHEGMTLESGFENG